MTTPIIDPSTLSEEQREAISQKYHSCIATIKSQWKPKHHDIREQKRSQAQALVWLFGSEFFTNQKGE